ncbi:MAG: hypothetical protein LBE56_01920 [Tannerella sp.]|jgi:C-terminal processing protease CtpA/Prc|nr:hypothetical protein [Tannerella sp.]
MKTNNLKWIWLLIACMEFFFVSCEKEIVNPEPDPTGQEEPQEPEEPGNPLSDEIRLKVNNFIATDVRDYYLWTSTINWSNVVPENEPDPFGFFDKLQYKSTDQWSMLTDDAEGFMNSVDGIATSYGYELIWGTFRDTNTMFAIVLFVYHDSPAEKAGLKRGDFIVSLNGTEPNITEANYMDLYNSPTISLGRAFITADGNLQMDRNPVNMTAVLLYQDPVVKDTIIVKGSHRIGYLFYSSYTMESEQRLQEVFTDFKNRGVTDVILDLRYNGGGYTHTSQLLSSILAPTSAVERQDIFLIDTWNDEMMSYFKLINEDPNEYFTKTASVNMNLSRLYVLTLPYTASASEATMIGLSPYIDVIQIGEETHGKYYGGALLTPLILDRRINEWVPDTAIENWMLYLMIFRYADKNGDTSFSGGLTPDIYVEETYDFLLPPLGDERDPLLGKAIEQITGQAVSTRSATASLRRPHQINGALLRSPLNGKMISDRKLPVPMYK